jgi:catechol 2,3-dioxygenase-like lactoylglutathione lyase family enzyme
MKYICPLITVSDIQQSRYFYEQLLHQKVKYDFGENITFEGDFALHLQSHYKQLIDNKEIKTGGNNFELYFENDQLEETVATLKANKVVFIHEIREQPWRQKVVRFYDPDQHIIEIGESLEHLCFRLHQEGLSNEQISKTTYLPVEYIISCIEQFSNK